MKQNERTKYKQGHQIQSVKGFDAINDQFKKIYWKQIRNPKSGFKIKWIAIRSLWIMRSWGKVSEARQKRVKAWFAEKWEYVTDQDFLIDTAALCIVIAMICWAFGIGKWFIECVKVANGG